MKIKKLIPADVGRVASKFSSLSRIKAEEWKNWSLQLSSLALFSCKTHLQQEDLDIWANFVKFLQILCLRFVNKTQLAQAQQFLMEYLIGFRERYGPRLCVPNHHNVIHLLKHISELGPGLSFSAFPYV
jgi:hypothetical protein